VSNKLQHWNSMCESRLERAPAEATRAKRFELEFASVLVGTGLGLGEALSVAERAASNPARLAEYLHRISNEFLLSTPSGADRS
jgi:hypothetical protein